MDVLVAGKLSTISAGFCNLLGKRHKAILAADDIDLLNIGKSVDAMSMDLYGNQYDALFQSNSFEAVIFISGSADGRRNYPEELSDLEHTLRLCAEHGIEKVIYVSSASVYAGLEQIEEGTRAEPIDSTGVILASCERLCRYYRKNEAMSILTMHVPLLYGKGEKTSLIAEAVWNALRGEPITLWGAEEQICEFLSEEEFVELLLRVLEDWPSERDVLDAPGGCALTFGELKTQLLQLPGVETVECTEKNFTVPVPLTSRTARVEYGWLAIRDVRDELPTMYQVCQKRIQPKKKTLWQRMKKAFTTHQLIVRIIDVLIGFAVMQWLNQTTSTVVQFQYIDFRLLYVVLIAVTHGLKTGMAAAFLACLSCLNAYSTIGFDWYVLLYNIDNWLPFAGYFLAAAVAGYTKDRYISENKFLKEEKKALEERYIFLSKLYEESLANKGEFKNQILTYRDSFGRIFEITRRLNSVVPEVIFSEALGALEDILQNQTISIYTVTPDGYYGRLVVCSQKISRITAKSLKLEDYKEMLETLREGEVWSNTGHLPDYPEYCAPVFRDGKPVVLVLVQKVRFEQMAMYYRNLIMVLSGLLQVSLLRAFEYNERIEDVLYLPGTRVLNQERFVEVLKTEEEMREKEIAEFSLFRIEVSTDEIKSIAEVVSQNLRATDLLGIGEDNALYVLLPQTGHASAQLVRERFQKAGLSFEAVGSQEIHTEGGEAD